MVVNHPKGGKTNDTVEEITEAEVEDEEEYWISHHGKLLTKLPLDPLRKAVEIDESGDGDNITNSSDAPNGSNNEKHPIASVLH